MAEKCADESGEEEEQEEKGNREKVPSKVGVDIDDIALSRASKRQKQTGTPPESEPDSDDPASEGVHPQQHPTPLPLQPLSFSHHQTHLLCPKQPIRLCLFPLSKD